MRIGYISFEYPPDTAYGGIATYVHQAAVLMKRRGHDVVVFTSSPDHDDQLIQDDVLVYRVKCAAREDFRNMILPVFTEQHKTKPFELIESPEYFADGLSIKDAFPGLPLVVKLHTPDSFIRSLTSHYTSVTAKLRYMLGGIRRGKWSDPFWRWRKKEIDIEYKITSIADQVHTPSVSLGDIVAGKWGIPRSRILNVPYPFVPTEKFLTITPGSTKKRILFLGRLEVRKGIVELVKALPLVFDHHRDARIDFVGRDCPSHLAGITMQTFIQQQLSEYKDQVAFRQVTPEQIPEVLKEAAVCVFPSIWENFPNVCLESMSAARAIVASNKGGMADMLQNEVSGILVDPLDPKAIARAITVLLESPEIRESMGKEARQKVLGAYNIDVIGSLMENKYMQLINNK